jgi:hypothetical protein
VLAPGPSCWPNLMPFGFGTPLGASPTAAHIAAIARVRLAVSAKGDRLGRTLRAAVHELDGKRRTDAAVVCALRETIFELVEVVAPAGWWLRS